MTLDYARTITRPPGRAWLLLTLACAIAPFCTGIAIFLLWLETRWEIFPVLGIITILVGLSFVPVAWFGAARYVRACELAGATPQLRYIRFANNLIVASTFVAILLGMAAYQITTRITVIVTNRGDAPLDAVTIITPSSKPTVGPIAPGERVSRTIRITDDGAVSFTVSRGGANVPITQDVYVDPFHNDGRIHLRVTNTGFVLRQPTP